MNITRNTSIEINYLSGFRLLIRRFKPHKHNWRALGLSNIGCSYCNTQRTNPDKAGQLIEQNFSRSPANQPNKKGK